jgi:hypothetical protein
MIQLLRPLLQPPPPPNEHYALKLACKHHLTEMSWCLDHGWTRGDVIYTVFGNLVAVSSVDKIAAWPIRQKMPSLLPATKKALRPCARFVNFDSRLRKPHKR